ncbi:hypothetical protein [Paraburkholderia sp. C35]|uniref:hypothetical protein n=1 Tax=Paraburkholderia sp. C35 TaxID=2126993 RepID=UPI000D686780|nr:hypothetical protein [Paraburkholderia sp. C35]
MSDIQDAAPSSTEPQQAPVGEPAGGASAPVVTESSGTPQQTPDTPSIPTGAIQTGQPTESPIPSTSSEGGTPVEAGGSAPPVIAGNPAGPADSADTATSTDVAPLSPATADAVATFANLMDRFETKTYEDGSTVSTVGELPQASVVSYPERTEPADDTPLGWCNQLDQFIVKATGSARTDGNRLVAKLRDYLQGQ